MTTCPSSPDGNDLTFPLAGGNSEKSTYSLASILSTIFFGSAGRLAPADTKGLRDNGSFFPPWLVRFASI